MDSADLIEPFATLPWGTIDRKDLTRPKLFMHQWNLWVVSDVLSTVRLANTTADGKPMNVENGVVKQVAHRPPQPRRHEVAGPQAPVEVDPYATAPAAATPPAEDHPGHRGDGQELLHHRPRPRRVEQVLRGPAPEVTCVVSSARLPELLKAIAQTNYMTVTDLDIDSAVDVG